MRSIRINPTDYNHVRANERRLVVRIACYLIAFALAGLLWGCGARCPVVNPGDVAEHCHQQTMRHAAKHGCKAPNTCSAVYSRCVERHY